MKKRMILLFLCFVMPALAAYAESDTDRRIDQKSSARSVPSEDIVNVTQFSLSPAIPPQVGLPVTVNVSGSCASGKTVYYKYYYCANYGSSSYDTTPWTVVKDYSTDSSAQYSFPQAGNYILVVRAVVDPNNEPDALPIVGQAVTVSELGQVNITALSSSSAAPRAGDEVTFTASASTLTGAPVYYRFYYCPNYGTSSYATSPWTMVKDYSTANSCKFVFPSAGSYVVVARAVSDPSNEPAALPIIGTAVSVGESGSGGQASVDMNDGMWEITTTMQGVPGMPPITRTTTQCLTQNDSTPDTGDSTCTSTTPVVNGNTITWSSVCQSEDCGQSTYNGTVTYSGDTFSGSMTIESSCGNYTIQMSGRRIGACS